MVDPSEGEAIQTLAESANSPFPYEGCRTVMARNSGEYEGLIPDLDLYFSTIAGYASAASRISSWDANRLQRARNDLACSFFELHPEYELLTREIDDDIAPDLAEQLRFHEELRTRLLALVRNVILSSVKP